jgi:hypothetical protein
VAKIGPSIVFGAAAGVYAFAERLLVGPEVYGSTTLNFSAHGQSAQVRPLDGRTSPVELLLGAQWRIVDNWFIGAAVGCGLDSAPGASAGRALLNLKWQLGR